MLHTLPVKGKEEVARLRASALKGAMDVQGIAPVELASRITDDPEERRRWATLFSNARGAHCVLPISRAELIAPLLGKKPEELVVAVTAREAARNGQVEEAAPEAPPERRLTEDALKLERCSALDALMTRKGKSASDLAEATGEAGQDEIALAERAMQIAEWRQGAGEGMPSAAFLRRIAAVAGVADPSTLVVEETEAEWAESHPPTPPRPRKASRPKVQRAKALPPLPKAKKPRKVRAAPARVKEEPEDIVATIDLSGDDLESLFPNGISAEIVRGEKSFQARPKSVDLTKDEVIALLARRAR